MTQLAPKSYLIRLPIGWYLRIFAFIAFFETALTDIKPIKLIRNPIDELEVHPKFIPDLFIPIFDDTREFQPEDYQRFVSEKRIDVLHFQALIITKPAVPEKLIAAVAAVAKR